MQAIADASVVSGEVDDTGHLQLTTSGGTEIDAGDVAGPVGPTGPPGPAGSAGDAPSGAIMMFGATIPPSGWLVCDGSAVSRTTFAALFSAIGTAFGAGNGSTTFNLPDFRARMPRQDNVNLGVQGGTTPTSHNHTVQGGTTPVTAQISISQSDSGPNLWINRQPGDTWTANFQVNDTSAGTSNDDRVNGALVTGITAKTTDTLPPYLNVSFIVKT
jgi:microcystin-dependent protein